MNMQAMLKQAQKMQKDMMKSQEEINEKTFYGESSFVKVIMLSPATLGNTSIFVYTVAVLSNKPWISNIYI